MVVNYLYSDCYRYVPLQGHHCLERRHQAGGTPALHIYDNHLKSFFFNLNRQSQDKFLNELEIFKDYGQPSSERIAAYIADELSQMIKEPGVKVTRVSAWESDDSCATYIPG